jgi:Cu(I)/Ag(I) efflux system protein CusF
MIAQPHNPNPKKETTMHKTLTLVSGLILSAGTAFAQTSDMTSMDHGAMDHSTMGHGEMPMDQAMLDSAIHVKAIVHSMGDGTVNVSHEPIPEIGWPAMTMDMTLMENAEVMEDMADGQAVTMMLIQGEDGMYGVAALVPDM